MSAEALVAIRLLENECVCDIVHQRNRKLRI